MQKRFCINFLFFQNFFNININKLYKEKTQIYEIKQYRHRFADSLTHYLYDFYKISKLEKEYLEKQSEDNQISLLSNQLSKNIVNMVLDIQKHQLNHDRCLKNTYSNFFNLLLNPYKKATEVFSLLTHLDTFLLYFVILTVLPINFFIILFQNITSQSIYINFLKGIIMSKFSTRVYTAFLFVPLIGFIVNHSLINSYAYFLLIIGLLVTSYACFSVNFQSNIAEGIRKSIGCLSTALLILFLSAQIEQILTNVYKIDFAQQISFAVKTILMLSNMQGNLQLCTLKNSKKAQPQKSKSQLADNII